jgi:ABC-type phosphate/phosphonate transport system ATPase subunit
MADNKIIFSMVGVGKVFKPNKQVLKDIYLSFYHGAKIGVLGLNGSGGLSRVPTRITSETSPPRRESPSAICRRNRNSIQPGRSSRSSKKAPRQQWPS